MPEVKTSYSVYTMRKREEERLPVLTDEVSNLTTVAGREAILSCHVSHLGSYKVITFLSVSLSLFLSLSSYIV